MVTTRDEIIVIATMRLSNPTCLRRRKKNLHTKEVKRLKVHRNDSVHHEGNRRSFKRLLSRTDEQRSKYGSKISRKLQMKS